MQRWFCLALLAVLLASTHAGAEEQPQPLFNGHDFQGWRLPAGNQWWTIHDGVLVAKSDPEQTGSILWTENEYTDFVLEFEFKLGSGAVDSGVFVREEREQIQIGESGSLMRDMTGAPYIAGKGYPVEGVGVSKLLKQDGWNKMTLRAVGNVYTVTLNGQRVLEYPSLTAVAKGPIGLQLHPQREMQIEFRNIKLAEL